MIKYKIKVMDELRKLGYDTNYFKREKTLSASTMQRLRNEEDVNTKTLNVVCLMLRKQISDIIEIVPTDEEKVKYF